MLLSIIVPVLNESDNIVAGLKPLQALREAKKIEVIIADGGSEDDTTTKASLLSDVVVSSKCGRSLQMNAGAECASGDVLLFLHADTLLPIDFIVEIENMFTHDKNRWGFFPVELTGSHWLLSIVAGGINSRSRLTSVATGDQSIFVGRDLFLLAGQFPIIPLMEDVAFTKKLRTFASPKICTRKVMTSSRRWETNGVLKTILMMWWLRLQYFLGVDPEKLARTYYPRS